MKWKIFSAAFFFAPFFAVSALTPMEVVDAFEKTYSSISDYQCRTYEYCRQGGKYEEKTIDFYFKRPRLIRMDVLRSNKPAETGSVGVYLNDGKVTGRRGGILSFLAVTLDKHDPMVTTIRGTTFDQGDIQAIVEWIRAHVSGSDCSLDMSDGVYELVSIPRQAPPNGSITKEVLRLDSASLLPVSLDAYMGDLIVQHASWTDYIVNAGISCDLFNVYWDPARLAEMGIASIHSLPLE